jgi:hypothetical protein
MTIRRRVSLDEALTELEHGSLTGVATIVVNTELWKSLSSAQKDLYRRRCADREVELRADDGVPKHFVELLGDAEGPLRSERRV